MSKMFMGIKGEGLVVNVTITADPTIANITVVTAGTGYEVGDVITFAAVGDGSNAGDYGSFTYTLVAGDFHDQATDVLNLNALTGTTSTIENGVAGTTNSAVHTVTDGTTGLPAAINNAFNKDISAWNVSSVDDSGNGMSEMFAYSNFNNGGASLNGWERVEGVGGATSTSTVASVTNMESMFEGASAFNADISEWNVSGVTTPGTMNNMFKSAALFDQPIYKWTLNATAPNVNDMFSGATVMHNSYGTSISPAAYDGFDNTPSTTGVSFFHYCFRTGDYR